MNLKKRKRQKRKMNFWGRPKNRLFGWRNGIVSFVLASQHDVDCLDLHLSRFVDVVRLVQSFRVGSWQQRGRTVAVSAQQTDWSADFGAVHGTGGHVGRCRWRPTVETRSVAPIVQLLHRTAKRRWNGTNFFLFLYLFHYFCLFLTSCLALCKTVSRPQFSAQSLYSNSLALVHFTCFSNSFALQKRTSPLVGQSAKVCELRRNEK